MYTDKMTNLKYYGAKNVAKTDCSVNYFPTYDKDTTTPYSGSAITFSNIYISAYGPIYYLKATDIYVQI